MNVFKRTRRLPDGTTTESEEYYCRIRSGGRDRWINLQTANRAEALRRAKDAEAKAGTDKFDAWREATALRQGATITALAQRWRSLGYPDSADRPRDPQAAERVAWFLDVALAWWGPRNPHHVTIEDMRAYARHRRAQVAGKRAGWTGDRSVDLELNSLSLLCDWARGHGLDANPFLRRPKFRASDDVRHCHLDMPDGADELDRIAGWLIEHGGPAGHVAAAQLLFQAMTGLRPGEPGALRHPAAAGQPGHLYEIRRDDVPTTLMAVTRQKHGINPAVRVHADLRRLLTCWTQHIERTWPDSPWLFPNPADPTKPMVPYSRTADSQLGKLLHRACEALGLPRRRPHAMRAYYVRVRRAQDVDDALIGSELGERTGASLVVATYGKPDGIRGDGRYTWLPVGRLPVWATAWGTTDTATQPAQEAAR